MKKKFYHKLGPVPTEEDLKSPKKLIMSKKEDESNIGLRNYTNRSHNFILGNIEENGI